MKRSVLWKALALCTTLAAPTPVWAASDSSGERTVPAEPPIGLTASLDGVPDLAPVTLATPYKLEWQQRLLAFQRSFEAKLKGELPEIDPIETGSINGAR